MDGGTFVRRDYLLGPSDGLPMHAIIADVAQKYRLRYTDLTGFRRQRSIMWPRQEAYWRCRNETDASYPEIARTFGGRDHTTIMHGIKAYEERLKQKGEGR